LKVEVKNARKNGYYLEITRESAKRLLHSKYAPRQEAKKWADKYCRDLKGKNLALIGGGLGYLPEILEERGFDCLVFEPLPEFNSPPDTPLSKLKKQNKIIFPAGEDDIESYLDKFSGEYLQELQVLVHPSYGDLIPEEVDRLRNQVVLIGRKIHRDRRTRKKFYWLWFDNLIQNLPLLDGGHRLNELRNLYSKEAAVIVGAGPSLGESLDWLKKYADRFLLICVDSALATLQSAGVKADFVLTTDPQSTNNLYLEGVEPEGRLIAAWTAQPAYFRWADDQPIYPINIAHGTIHKKQMFPPGGWIREYVEGLDDLQSGGSVTSTALDLAQYLAVQTIALVGVDHAFTKNRIVSPGNCWERRQLNRLNRFKSLAGSHLNSFLGSGRYSSKSLLKATCLGDYTYWTTDEYVNQNQWFEEAGKLLPARCLDMRAGGLKMRYWERVDNPENFWKEIAPIKPVAEKLPEKRPVRINREELIEKCRQLSDYIEAESDQLIYKFSTASGKRPERLEKFYDPFREYAGLDGSTSDELAKEFFRKLPKRLRNLAAQLS